MTEPAIPIVYAQSVKGEPLYVLSATPEDEHRGGLSRGQSARFSLPTRIDDSFLSAETLQTLEYQGYTRGLAQALMKNKLAFSLAIWIVDNSGSMNAQDGHRFAETSKKDNLKLVPCTRWAEMQQTVDYHIQMAALIKKPTIFRMLNDPGRICGPQQFSIAERGDAFLDEDLAIAQSTIMNAQPMGVTPLTSHLREIRANIVALEPSLRANGMNVAIIIATDGLPSDPHGYTTDAVKREFVAALESLQGLPVWLVVRLCTDEDSVVDFWNSLDSQLELSLEVLDDFTSEAKELHEHNPWLNYGLPLHRMREMGFHSKVFDLLDERKFSKNELRDFCRILFGDDAMAHIPDPEGDWKGFYDRVSNLVNKEKKQWNPISGRMEPWINLRVLKSRYGPGWFW